MSGRKEGEAPSERLKRLRFVAFEASVAYTDGAARCHVYAIRKKLCSMGDGVMFQKCVLCTFIVLILACFGCGGSDAPPAASDEEATSGPAATTTPEPSPGEPSVAVTPETINQAAELPSWGIGLTGKSADRLDDLLRRASTPVIGRIIDKKLVLDVRTVATAEDIAATVAAVDSLPPE